MGRPTTWPNCGHGGPVASTGVRSLQSGWLRSYREADRVSSPRMRLGKWGEGVASRFLQDIGYQVLETNYRCRWGEVDIVAREGDDLVFVEVRTRSSGQFGTPEESITPAKGQRLVATAQDYLQRHVEDSPEWRIDLIAIRLGRGRRVEDIAHLRHAVEL